MLRFLVLSLLLIVIPTGEANTHGGGLNASGCHNDRKRGGYHCHRSPSRPVVPARLISTPSKLYANCAEARAAGAAPVRRGDRGYGTHLDRDGDGIGCEGSSSGRATVMPAPVVSPVRPPVQSIATLPKLPVPIEGLAQALDGDTIQIGLMRVRLFGIDAFEGEQLCKTSDDNPYGCGGRATRTLIEKMDGQSVTCMPKGIDAYGRTLAVCRVKSTDLSSYMVRSGYALAYTKYALDYVSDEQAAKEDKSGAWGGSFDLPWDYRATRPGGAAEAQRSIAPSANCTIKGNVNKTGERIYHLSSDPFYTRTKPENWFCSISEAEAAGFRRAGSP